MTCLRKRRRDWEASLTKRWSWSTRDIKSSNKIRVPSIKIAATTITVTHQKPKFHPSVATRAVMEAILVVIITITLTTIPPALVRARRTLSTHTKMMSPTPPINNLKERWSTCNSSINIRKSLSLFKRTISNLPIINTQRKVEVDLKRRRTSINEIECPSA